jgi:hypothetical protein
VNNGKKPLGLMQLLDATAALRRSLEVLHAAMRSGA